MADISSNYTNTFIDDITLNCLLPFLDANSIIKILSTTNSLQQSFCRNLSLIRQEFARKVTIHLEALPEYVNNDYIGELDQTNFIELVRRVPSQLDSLSFTILTLPPPKHYSNGNYSYWSTKTWSYTTKGRFTREHIEVKRGPFSVFIYYRRRIYRDFVPLDMLPLLALFHVEYQEDFLELFPNIPLLPNVIYPIKGAKEKINRVLGDCYKPYLLCSRKDTNVTYEKLGLTVRILPRKFAQDLISILTKEHFSTMSYRIPASFPLTKIISIHQQALSMYQSQIGRIVENAISLALQFGADQLIELLKYFLTVPGLDINYPYGDQFCNYGETLLDFACGTQNLELVKFLLSKGADPDGRAPNQGSPLLNTLVRHAEFDSNSTNTILIIKQLQQHGLQISLTRELKDVNRLSVYQDNPSNDPLLQNIFNQLLPDLYLSH